MGVPTRNPIALRIAPAEARDGYPLRRSAASVLAALLVLLAAAATGLAATIAGAQPASAATGGQTALYGSLDSSRASSGLGPMLRNPSLETTAQSWAVKLAASGVLKHDPDVFTAIPGGYTRAAENVGTSTGGTAGVHKAWLASSSHQANMMSTAFTDVGIGVAVDAKGATWAVQVFAQYPGHQVGSLKPPVPVDHVRYSWSPTIYSVTGTGTTAVWKRLSYADWTAAGSPAPRTVSWVQGTSCYSFVTSSELFALAPDGVRHKLTYAEWTAAGSPDWTRGSTGWVRVADRATIWRITRDGTVTAVTGEQWAAEDSPTPQLRSTPPA